MILQDSFTEALSTLPRPGGNGYHPRLLGVANIGIRAGVPPEEVAAALRANTPPGGRRVPDREIGRRQLHLPIDDNYTYPLKA